MKGIILAAGKGTRLYPMTRPCPKPLLPVYDKPMVYYPLALLLMAGITEILIIIPPGDKAFEELLGDGTSIGVSITYKEQPVARGIADAFIVGEEFIGDDSVCLVLGDNVFFGEMMDDILRASSCQSIAGSGDFWGARVFGYYVDDPRPFGVVEIGEDGKAISIEEKPSEPKSNYIIPGLYFYDNRVVDIAKNIQPSARGELEITTVNNVYLSWNELMVSELDRDIQWFDTGTAESIFEASKAIREYQIRHGVSVGNIDAIAYRVGLIDAETLKRTGEGMAATEYGKYLLSVVG